MAISDISALPDDARLWVFGADRALDGAEAVLLRTELERFVEAWTAHSADLAAGCALHEDRFALVAVDETRVGASGCSIDALLRELGRLEEVLDARLTQGSLVWYRTATGSIASCGREEFRELGGRGAVDAGTPVFDLTIDRLGDWRGDRFERAAGETWHARLIEAAVATRGERS